MNNMDSSIREDILSEYIDSLNSEEIPVSLNEDDIDDEMLELFETVRAVKRLKGTEVEELLIKKGKSNSKKRFNSYIKVATTIAAVFVIFISSLAIKNFVFSNSGKKSSSSDNAAIYNTAQGKPDESIKMDSTDGTKNKSEEPSMGGTQGFTAGTADATLNDRANGNAAMKSAVSPNNESFMKALPETTITSAKNSIIVYEMQTAYEGISNYSEIVEIQTINNENLVASEEVKITYKKPDKYITAEVTEGSTIKQYSDGDRLCIIDGSRVSIDFVYPGKNLWKYHIEQQIKDLEAASEIREAGSEIVSGKNTQIYEYRSSGDEKYNRIWIDKKTKLPVKREINTADGKVINIFKELYLNGVVSDSSFNYNIKSSDDVYYLNEKTTRSEAEEFIPQIRNIINCVPEYLSLHKTVKLKNDLYSYYLNFTDESKKNFLDIYISNKAVTSFYTPGDAHGSLQDGWTESESGTSNVFKIYIGKSNTFKWIGKSYEIAMVSNIDTMELLKIIEDASNSKITSISEEQLKNMGITQKP